MTLKLLSQYKRKVGRRKVYNRYRRIVDSLPPQVFIEKGESFESYSARVVKHLNLLNRCTRLNRIFLKYCREEA